MADLPLTPPGGNPEEVDPDWSKYPDTVLRFASGVVIDLRQPITVTEAEALRSLGLNAPFSVMTAHDPNGQKLDAAENRLRASRLEVELETRHLPFVRLEACSPDASHCESSVAVLMKQDDAVEVAKRFSQVAIFWFDGEKFWIVGAVVAGDPVMLPRPF